MSHFTKLSQADVRSPDAFIAALKELGFTGEVKRDTKIKDAAGASKNVTVSIKTGDYVRGGANREAALGLEKNEKGRYNIVADFWAVRKNLPASLGYVRSDKDLHDAVLRATTRQDIVSNYRRQGFIARVTENADHSVNISLTR